MPEVRVVESLAEIGREAWGALFPGEIEDFDYLTAVERAGLEGFRWRYAVAYQDGRPVAAAPGFLTEYPLETTLSGAGRRLAEAARRVLPDALTLRLACLGSPCTERAMLGLSPSVPAAERATLAQALICGFERAARRERCSLMGLKDVAEHDRPLWAAATAGLGYQPVASLPIAHLDIDFPSVEAYCARLGPGTRKDMRRKLRVADRVRIEVRANVDDVIDRIMALYADTLSRAEMSLETLTRDYFLGALYEMPDRAFFVLYFEGEDLLAANLVLLDGQTLLDKYFCMDAVRGRALNLYFLSWFTNVQFCLDRGLSRYQAGQAAYEVKLRLGSRLTRTDNWFRHRNPLVNGVLQAFAPLFAVDPTRDLAA